jgi:hypothetical protein
MPRQTINCMIISCLLLDGTVLLCVSIYLRNRKKPRAKLIALKNGKEK